MADFGWSASCVLEAAKLANEIRKAFQESGGAKDKFADAIEFLTHIDATFVHLGENIERHPDSWHKDAIVKQLKLMEKPMKRLGTVYLEKYEKSLGVHSTRSKIRQAPRKIDWVLREMDEAVRKEKANILEPLHLINCLIPQQILESLQDLSKKCQKIIDDPRLTDMSKHIEGRFKSSERHAATQQETWKANLEALNHLKYSLENQKAQIEELGDQITDLEFLRVESETFNEHQRQQIENLKSIMNETSKTAAALRSIERTISRQETLDGELRDQLRGHQTSINAMNESMQKLLQCNQFPTCKVAIGTALVSGSAGYAIKSLEESRTDSQPVGDPDQTSTELDTCTSTNLCEKVEHDNNILEDFKPLDVLSPPIDQNPSPALSILGSIRGIEWVIGFMRRRSSTESVNNEPILSEKSEKIETLSTKMVAFEASNDPVVSEKGEQREVKRTKARRRKSKKSKQLASFVQKDINYALTNLLDNTWNCPICGTQNCNWEDMCAVCKYSTERGF